MPLVRRALLIALACVCAVLAAPASALAAGMTIDSADNVTDATETIVGNSCTFTATADGATVGAPPIQSCIQDGNTVQVDDSYGSIDVEAPIGDSGPSSLTLTETAGPIEVDAAVTLPNCELDLEAESGSITQGTGGDLGVSMLDLAGGGTISLSNTGNAVQTLVASDALPGSLVFRNSRSFSVQSVQLTDGDATLTSLTGGLADTGTINTGGGSGTVRLNADGAITQSGSGAITAPTAVASTDGGDVDLTAPGNAFMTLGSSNSSGALNVVDSEPLSVSGFSAQSTSSVDSTGDLDVTGAVSEVGRLTLISASGAVSGSGAITAGTLDASAPNGSVDLTGANVPSALAANAGDGPVTVDMQNPAVVTVGAVAAAESVALTNSAGALAVHGAMTGTSVSLGAEGFSGDGGTVSAVNVSFVDATATDAWVIEPGSVTDGGNAPVALAGTSLLSVSGGSTFSVEPSASTSYVVNSSPGSSGTLYYLSGGLTVDGTPPTPNGTISAAGVDSVSYTGMGTVTVKSSASSGGSSGGSGAGGSAGGAGGGGSGAGGGTKEPAPSICTFSLTSDRIKLPKLVHGKRRGRATLVASVRCTKTEQAVLSGAIAVVSKLHGKTKYRDYTLAAFRATAKAGVDTKITIDLPPAVEAAAGTKAMLSGEFTLGGRAGGHYLSLAPNMGVAHIV